MTDVLVSTIGALGRLTLNRPKALNALTLDMMRAIDSALTEWCDDDRIRAILIDGTGDRAFCAGGDIRALYKTVEDSRFEFAIIFFREEYRLNARLARYPKPIVTLMSGLTMGGGIGLGAHVSHRIVTDNSKLAMPEVSIGFFPDVGGTYLLGTAPSELGTHAALTGAPMGPADALACGLADRFIEAAKLGALPDLLSRCRSREEVSAALDDLASEPTAGPLAVSRSWIARCFCGDSVGAIVTALAEAPETEARSAAERLRANCPMSLRVTLKALRRARELDHLEACLDQEFRIALRSVRRADFLEGIRAAVIDKDKHPAWRPTWIGDVDESEADAHFASLGLDELGLAESAMERKNT